MKFELKENGTQLDWRVTGDVGGVFMMAEGLVVKLLGKQMTTHFEALKQLLESGQVQAYRVLSAPLCKDKRLALALKAG